MSVEWNGDALPPEGCECEVKSGKNSWALCRVVHSSSAGVAFVYLEEPSAEVSSRYIGVIDSIPYHHAPDYFRPIRTEAERKRSDICDKIYGAMCKAERKDNRSDMAEAVYDAIATGKIPQITLK